MTSIYPFSAQLNGGEKCELESFRGNVLLIVNTASRCSFTQQYHGLEQLQQQYHRRGFDVLAFPCNQFGGQEPEDDEHIRNFCDLKFNISFPLFTKINVNGEEAHPLFIYLKQACPGFLGTKKIKWNFTKFLVDKNGEVVKRYAPTVKPRAIANDIESLLSN